MSKLLDILLQRNDAAVAWGFRVCGGRDQATQPIISAVTQGTLASQYLNVGDTLLEIEKLKGETLSQSEINGLIDNTGPCLQLLVEKRPIVQTACVIPNGIGRSIKQEIKNHSYETSREQECVKEKDGVTQSTKIWLKERNRNGALGEYDLEVNFLRTKYRQEEGVEEKFGPEESDKNKNRERMRIMSENFDKVFREKIGEWLHENMLDASGINGKQQSNVSQTGNGSVGGQPPPPPPPSLPGVITGRRLKTEIPERSLEPPAAIQNAMLTKDKKPFTYTPGGIDLSEIRSPRMARRINRNAQADEMHGIPAPTTNHHVPVENHGNTNYSAMQSQLPSQVLPPNGAAPPPPPPPPPPPTTGSAPGPVAAAHPPATSAPAPKPVIGKPALPFDPNELLARVNKSPAYEPSVNHHVVPPQNFRSQPVEEKPNFLTQQRPKSSDMGPKVFTPPQNESGHSYTTPVSPKVQNELGTSFVVNHPPRSHVSSASVSASANVQEKTTPPSTPFGNKIQHNFTPTSPSIADSKAQPPWVTAQRIPQSSAPWANRENEISKPGNTRIIPIQVEGRDSPKSPSPSVQTPPPFMLSPQARQQQYANQQPQQMRQQFPAQQNQQVRQQSPAQQQQPSNTRVIPIQIERGGSVQQPKSPVGGLPQNRFSPMTPQSPAPYSPSLEKDQKPQWASVQPTPFKKESERFPQQQQSQPEYNTYNTAGVPVGQLRKMQLSDDDRALMDKFKSQVELHGNDILNDENTNPRYKGGYIPSRVFKMLDESVDDETYLHRESDPRYRGAVIPSRAFRILQSMTDTAGEMQQQVPRSPPQTAVYNRPHGGVQYSQEPPQSPYVPPSEQQVQEPRKYTGGSIPSRSFRMLQAMTGQEVSASNSSGPSSGRETPVSGNNRWCTSPSPSPVPDPYWACYYPPDPYFLYNYISDLNAAYGLPPPPPPSPFGYPRSPLPPFHYQMYPYCGSDNDEPGYSSTDELAQYYANYRRNFGYSPYQPNNERSHPSTPIPFRVPRVCVTPVGRKEVVKHEKIIKDMRNVSMSVERIQKKERDKDFELKIDEEDTETETEVDCEPESTLESSRKMNNLLSLKSVSNLSLYTAKSCSSVEENHYHLSETEQEREEEEEEDDDISTSESFEETEPHEPISHQLSVIFEESEHSEIDNIRRQGCGNTISLSESCSTLGDEYEEENEFDDEKSFSEIESSVIVRLPLKVTCTRLDNDEAITTVIVGDSVIEKDALCSLSQSTESYYPKEEIADSESGDISVTFTLPSRSNSIISTDGNHSDCKKTEDRKEEKDENQITGKSEVETEVTIHLPRSNIMKVKEEDLSKESEKCESPQTEDDSTSTSVQSGQTILNHKEDTDEESEEEKEENKSKVHEEKNEVESEKKGCNESETTDNDRIQVKSYRANLERLEELISSMLESTKDSMGKSLEFLQINGELKKKDSQEESEEDDSGVTSDMSMKLINSETDGDTESDYSELCKMTQFQRASTHSRLYKLLLEECGKAVDEEDDDDEKEKVEKNVEKEKNTEDALAHRKQRLTLPLNHITPSEAESLSSNSDIVSPSSPIISDLLVKELIHSLLRRKNGKKFRKLPLAKLHSATLKILQEEMETWDRSLVSGDELVQVSSPRGSHSECTAEPSQSDQIYGDNYTDYHHYYNTWGKRNYCHPDDYDVIPSRTFRMLKERTMSLMPLEGFKVRCPRVTSKKDPGEPVSGRETPVVVPREAEPGAESLGFAEKQKIVAKVLEKTFNT